MLQGVAGNTAEEGEVLFYHYVQPAGGGMRRLCIIYKIMG